MPHDGGQWGTPVHELSKSGMPHLHDRWQKRLLRQACDSRWQCSHDGAWHLRRVRRQQLVHVRRHRRDGGVVEGQGAGQLQAQLAAEGAAQLHCRQRVKGTRREGAVIACTGHLAFSQTQVGDKPCLQRNPSSKYIDVQQRRERELTAANA